VQTSKLGSLSTTSKRPCSCSIVPIPASTQGLKSQVHLMAPFHLTKLDSLSRSSGSSPGGTSLFKIHAQNSNLPEGRNFPESAPVSDKRKKERTRRSNWALTHAWLPDRKQIFFFNWKHIITHLLQTSAYEIYFSKQILPKEHLITPWAFIKHKVTSNSA
jgi:hypothetical protein